jgi:malate synthase
MTFNKVNGGLKMAAAYICINILIEERDNTGIVHNIINRIKKYLYIGRASFTTHILNKFNKVDAKAILSQRTIRMKQQRLD